MKLSVREFDFNDFIEETVHSCRGICEDHIIYLKRLPKNLSLRGDKLRLGQVVTNLLTNAIKYSPPGSRISVMTGIENNKITICVKDTGIGIGYSKRSKIFEKYFRTGRGENAAQGMGLGLYIAKEIVTLHNGRIWVKSENNRGSAFYVQLPL
jgi:signal transduction histidine kinase